MFNVWNKETGNIQAVYDVSCEYLFEEEKIFFLIYDDSSWKYAPAEMFSEIPDK